MNAPFAVIVHLWIRLDLEDEFAEYEAEILNELPRFEARLVLRVRNEHFFEGGESPFEVHVLEFPDSEIYQEFLADPTLEKIRENAQDLITESRVWTDLQVIDEEDELC